MVNKQVLFSITAVVLYHFDFEDVVLQTVDYRAIFFFMSAQMLSHAATIMCHIELLTT